MKKNRIPKIIHQIWLGDQSKRPIDLMQTWIDKNPTWSYKLWTEIEVSELNLKCESQFNQDIHFAGKADILRYELLYNFGGFFIDADSECIRPLEDFLCDNITFGSYEHETGEEYMNGLGLIANGYLGSVPNNPLIGLIVEHISTLSNVNIRMPWEITGPKLLTEFIKKTNLPFTIYPSHYFIPIHYTDILNKNEGYTGSDYVFAKQYWGTTLGYENIKNNKEYDK